MTSRDSDRIINRLEYCAENKCDICQEENGSGFPWIDGRCYGFTERLYDALALLKAQEPRVMTIEEAANSTDPMWFEKSGDECGWITGIYCNHIQATTIGQVDGDDWYNLPITDYGRLWRCWTSRPTDEQREAIPWN